MPVLDEILRNLLKLRRSSHTLAEGGVPYSPRNDRDPYEILDELMIVVEVLSPRWPERDELTVGDCFRL